MSSAPLLVAEHCAGRPAEWTISLGSAVTLLASRVQTLYECLVPLPYPVMYDLGGIDNARNWYCDGGSGYNKHLFGEQADGAQFIGRFPARNRLRASR